MPTNDITALAADVLHNVRGFVQRSLEPLVSRLAALELRAPVPGAQGERGEKGEPGPAGRDGVNGERGEKGEPGPAGRDGVNGERGEKGEPGPAGRDGVNGERGERGEKGEPGANGRDGAVGERGEKGDPGQAGSSVSIDDIRPHVERAVTEQVAAIPKPADGRDGRDGPPGRDALQVEVLDHLDPAKRYARGTWATWRGGLVRSLRATDPLNGTDLDRAGWHVVVRGLDLDACAITLGEDLRTVTVQLGYTDGATIQTKQHIPAMLHRGVYQHGGSHEPGDVVTYGGSMWLAKSATTGPPPGDAWQLVVKGAK